MFSEELDPWPFFMTSPNRDTIYWKHSSCFIINGLFQTERNYLECPRSKTETFWWVSSRLVLETLPPWWTQCGAFRSWTDHLGQAPGMEYMEGTHTEYGGSDINIVSVLGREEGYTVKYDLSPREFPRAQAIFYRISLLESWYGPYPIPINDLLIFVLLILFFWVFECSSFSTS